MNLFTVTKKGVLGFLTGLAAAVLFGVIQALSNYKPIVCSETITENCTPQLVSTLYYGIIPIVVGAITAAANWFKNRTK